MKKIILLTLANLSLFICLKAQPVLTAAGNIPKQNDTYNVVQCDSTATEGSPGANQTWNFNTLTIDTAISYVNYLPPDATPYLADFPTSNLVSEQSLNGTELYDFFITDSSSWKELGAESSVITIKGIKPDIIFSYPFTYNSVIHNISNDTGSGGLTGYSVSTITGDGYGTLLLHGVTYNNVLRVKTTDSTNDYDPIFGNEISVDTDYNWYDTQHSFALLSIRYSHLSLLGTLFNDKSVVTFDNITGIQSPLATTLHVNLYPNPSAGNIIISCGLQRDEDVTIDIVNMLDETIMQRIENHQAAGNHNYIFNNLSSGIYFVKLKAGDATGTQKLIVSR